MMNSDFIELIRKRRSVREFTDEPLTDSEIELLKEMALRAPSSRNLRPWEFVFVTNRKILRQLSDCKPHGAEFLAGAALGVVVCADESKCDVWIEDCSIASIMLQFAAQSLGLGSCWAQVRKRQRTNGISSEEYIRNMLSLPDHFRVLCIIGIGRPAENPPPLPAESLPHDCIHAFDKSKAELNT